MSFGDVILLLLIVMFITPLAQLCGHWVRRARARRALQRARSSRCVEIIHHMQTAAVYGLPVLRWISFPLAVETLRAVARQPDEAPLDVIVHLPSGLLLEAGRIGEALARRTGPVTLIVPQEALCGSLLLALAADHVLMDPAARIGAVDVVLQSRQAAQILRRRLPAAEAGAVLQRLRGTGWHDDDAVTADQLRQLGLDVSTNLPAGYRRYLSLFKQPLGARTWPLLVRPPRSLGP